MKEGRIYRLSTLRFIPKGDKVSKVLIHLLSRIFHRHASQSQASLITMTVMSDSLCASLLKCSATGDSSVLRCVISYRWPLTLIWSGWLVSPTYWRPHLLHIIKYITLEDLQEALNFTLNTFPVVWLENSPVAISIEQVLHLGAPQGWLPGDSSSVVVRVDETFEGWRKQANVQKWQHLSHLYFSHARSDKDIQTKAHTRWRKHVYYVGLK